MTVHVFVTGETVTAAVLNEALSELASAPVATAAAGTVTVAATETRDAVLGNYTFTAVAGRRYEVRVNGLQVSGSVAADQYLANVRNGGASTPTAASTLVASQRVYTPVASAQIACPLAGTFVPGAGTQTLSVFLARTAGTGVGTPSALRELFVLDIGPA